MDENLMSAVVATVGPPTKKIGFPSNCLLSYTSNILTMTDDTTKRPFEQKAQFDAIAPNFESFLTRVPPYGKFRVVSFCSEYSILTASKIKDYCLKLALTRFQPNMRDSQFVSMGFVYDSSVRDFLSIEDTNSQLFEMIETFDSSEMIDLLECGLEKLRRIKDSVFVLRIGTNDNFFEWVIIPKTDSYVPSPSMAGLPPNEKLFYILNLLGTVNEQAVQRFQRSSSIFRLISDSFTDVPTFWVFHIAEDSTLKSNATLCKVASMLSKVKNLQLNCHPTNIYYIRNEEDENNLSSAASEEYLKSLSQEELEELEYLKSKIGGEAYLSSRKSIENMSQSSSRRRSYRLNASDLPEGEFEEEEEEYEYEYDEEQLERQADGTFLRKPRRKNKKLRKKKGQKDEKEPSKSMDELRAAEEEQRRKDQEEEEERRKAIESLRQSRSQKKDGSPKSEKRKSKSIKSAKSIIESSQYSKMSRRDKVSERIAKLKQMRANEEEEDEYEEEDSSELRELKKMKNLTEEERYMREMKKRLKNRQNKFTKVSILVNKAQRAAKDRNASIATLQSLQQQITEALKDAEQFRAEAKDEIAYLKDCLAYRRQKHEQNQQDIQDIRHDYLERHCENVEEIDKRKRKEAKQNAETLKKKNEEENKKKPERKIAITNRTPEYEMAVKYLEEEIEQVKKDISVLKKRQPNPAEA